MSHKDAVDMVRQVEVYTVPGSKPGKTISSPTVAASSSATVTSLVMPTRLAPGSQSPAR